MRQWLGRARRCRGEQLSEHVGDTGCDASSLYHPYTTLRHAKTDTAEVGVWLRMLGKEETKARRHSGNSLDRSNLSSKWPIRKSTFVPWLNDYFRRPGIVASCCHLEDWSRVIFAAAPAALKRRGTEARAPRIHIIGESNLSSKRPIRKEYAGN
jgi:hypothetical protein